MAGQISLEFPFLKKLKRRHIKIPHKGQSRSKIKSHCVNKFANAIRYDNSWAFPSHFPINTVNIAVHMQRMPFGWLFASRNYHLGHHIWCPHSVHLSQIMWRHKDSGRWKVEPICGFRDDKQVGRVERNKNERQYTVIKLILRDDESWRRHSVALCCGYFLDLRGKSKSVFGWDNLWLQHYEQLSYYFLLNRRLKERTK